MAVYEDEVFPQEIKLKGRSQPNSPCKKGNREADRQGWRGAATQGHKSTMREEVR